MENLLNRIKQIALFVYKCVDVGLMMIASQILIVITGQFCLMGLLIYKTNELIWKSGHHLGKYMFLRHVSLALTTAGDVGCEIGARIFMDSYHVLHFVCDELLYYLPLI